MKWTSLNDLRESYLSFFESKGHLRLGSFSLVPNNDKSLLLINSGMAVLAFQRLFGITESGAVGPVTWATIANQYDSFVNE